MSLITPVPYCGTVRIIKPMSLPPIICTTEQLLYVARLRRVKNGRGYTLRRPPEVVWEGWLSASQITGSEYLVVPKVQLPSSPRTVELRPLNFAQWRNRKGRTLIPIDPEVAEFLGWYVAEGDSKSNGYVRLSLNPFKDPLERIRGLIEHMGYRPTLRTKESEVELGFQSRMFSRWLRQFVGERAPRKRIPEEIFLSGSHVKKEFLCALFRGDGHAGEHAVRITTSSEGLLSDITYLLLTLGILPSTSRAINAEHHIGNRLVRGTIIYTATIYGNQRCKLSNSFVLGRSAQRFVDQRGRFLIPIAKTGLQDFTGTMFAVTTEVGHYLAPVMMCGCNKGYDST